MDEKTIIILYIVIPLSCIWLCLKCYSLYKCYSMTNIVNEIPIVDEIPINTNV